MLKASNLMGSAPVPICVNSSVNLLPCFFDRTPTVPGTTLSSSSQIRFQSSGDRRRILRSTLAAFPPSARNPTPPSGSCIARMAAGSIRYVRMPARKRSTGRKRLSPPTSGSARAFGSTSGTSDSTVLFQFVDPLSVKRRKESFCPSFRSTKQDSVATSKW